MDRFDAMRTLLAVVDGGSLTAASRRLGMPLATVSRKLTELEAQLRARVLIRTSRKLILTEAGQGYVQACRKILEDLDDAERAVAGEYRVPRGHLTIAASVQFGQLHVEPVVLDFLQAYPEISVRLALSDAITDMLDDHIDAAVRVGALADSGLVATGLGETGWVACASPAYLDAHGTPQSPEELAGHACVQFEGHASAAASSEVWRFGSGSSPLAVRITPRLRVNTASAALAAAIAGHGVARLLRYQVVRAVGDGQLRIVLPQFEPEPIPVHLIYPGGPVLPLKLRAFIDFAAPRLRAALAG